MKIILLLCFSLTVAYATNCNPGDLSGCPARESAAPSSPIAGSAWSPTGTTSIVLTKNVIYNSNFTTGCTNPSGGGNVSCTGFDAYYDTNAGPSTCMILAPHSGGWNTGNRATTGWLGGPPWDILTAQQTGCVVIPYDYRLSTTAPWPAQWQDTQCLIYYLVNDAGATIPGNRQDIRFYEGSAGAHMAIMAKLTQGQTPYADSCPTTRSTNYKITMVVGNSTPICLAASQTNCSKVTYTYAISGAVIPALKNLLNCSDLTTCAASDLALQASPLYWMNNSNLANMQGIFLQGTPLDTTIPIFDNPAGGNGNPMNLFNALSNFLGLTIPRYLRATVYPATSHGCGWYACVSVANCFTQQASIDGVTFLNGSPISGISGASTVGSTVQ